MTADEAYEVVGDLTRVHGLALVDPAEAALDGIRRYLEAFPAGDEWGEAPGHLNPSVLWMLRSWNFLEARDGPTLYRLTERGVRLHRALDYLRRTGRSYARMVT